jgi:DNA-directed RNA polymerase specialized sigma24 family protein
MDENEWLADRFEEHRAHLRAVAYRMLGSLTEADDAVQDTWLRVSRSGADEVENLGGWLTTIVARVCLNGLRRRKRTSAGRWVKLGARDRAQLLVFAYESGLARPGRLQ